MSGKPTKEEMLQKIGSINRVEGFDPTPFAVEYTDMNTGESRKRLPVMIQMAWFRLKYPEGRIAVEVNPARDCFVATARVYPSYKDGPECFLAEATASRGPDPAHPSVSPREWAQTAAVGIALRNAGFGLQFHAAGDAFLADAPDELGERPQGEPEPEPAYEVREPTPEEKLRQAQSTPCPIAKYSGKTLGEVLTLDPKAILWVANKFTGNQDISAAAKYLCDYALEQAAG